MSDPLMPSRSCSCGTAHAKPKRVVLTGGPGAGKTAVLELVRQYFCRHVKVLPEAAGIAFGGGFPRTARAASQRAAQRAIFYLQRELEATVDGDNAAIVLCDRGTVDGCAYWPGPDSLWSSIGTTREEQLGRYDAVIHLRTPALEQGYNHENPLRIESAEAAMSIDTKIVAAWDGHPRRSFVDSTTDFLSKAQQALELLRAEIPRCCREHAIPLS